MGEPVQWIIALSGIIALAYFLIAWFKRPQLEIIDARTGTWSFPGGVVRMCANIDVKNKGYTIANNCHAALRILATPPNVTHLQASYPLHWADTPYLPHTSCADPVDIVPRNDD